MTTFRKSTTTGTCQARNEMEFNIDRVAFSIFGLDVYWYGIIIVAGIFIAALFARSEFERRGYSPDIVDDILFAILPIGVIGARIWYVIFEWEYYGAHPKEIIDIRGGGLAIQGGILFGLIGLYLFSKRKKLPMLDLMDIMVPSLALAQAVGRWGNFANAEAHGYPTDLPWGIIIDGVKVHPTFFYESLGDFLIFLFLINYRKKNPAKAKQSAIYFICYGILRFFVEGLRTDSLYVFGLRTAQIMSIVFIIAGLCLLVYAKRNNLPPQFNKKEKKKKEERIIKFK